MRRQWAIGGVVLMCVVAAFVPVSRAQISPPTTAQVVSITEKQYRQQRYEFNKLTLAAAFEKFGDTSAPWAAEAREFLASTSITMANQFAYPSSAVADEVPKQQLIQQGQNIINQGCTDPVVLFCFFELFDWTSARMQGLRILDGAMPALATSKYPAFNIVQIAGRYYQANPARNSPAAQHALEVYKAHLGAMFDDPMISGDKRRIVLEMLTNPLEEWDIPTMTAVNAALQKSKADSWLKHAYAGHMLVKEAWNARGDGWAAGVTPDGWRQFSTFMLQAQTELEAAQQLAPQFPNAANEMITVAMGATDAVHLDAHQWFDRARAAQIDNEWTYMNYSRYLMPRWHGSLEAQFAVAREVAGSGQLDSDLPMIYMRLLEGMLADSQVSGELWKLPNVYETTVGLFNKLADSTGDRTTYRSGALAAAIRAGKYDDARKALDELNGNFAGPFFGQFKIRMRGEHVARIYAMTGSQGSFVAQADQLAATDPSAGAKAFDELLKQADPGDPGTPYLRYRAEGLRKVAQALGGEWTDIQPDANLTGWRAAEGNWNIQPDGSVVGKRNDKSAFIDLFFDGDVGTHYSIRAKLATNSTDPNSGLKACIEMCSPLDSRIYAVRVNTAAKSVILDKTSDGRQEQQVDWTEDSVFEIEVNSGKITVKMDNKPLWNAIELYRLEDLHRICLHAESPRGDSIVSFSEVKLKLYPDSFTAKK